MPVSATPRPSLLVLTSTFPKSIDDTTPPFVFQLCRHLLSQFDVTVLTPATRKAPETDVLQGVDVRRFHYFWPRSLERLADGAMLENLSRSPWLLLQAPFMVLFELLAALRLARAIRPDVIHAHWFVPQGIVAVLVGAMLRTPVVVTAHGADVYGLRGRLLDALRRKIASRCEAVTVVSGDMAAALPRVTSRRSERPKVMPMGVDTLRFSGAPERNGSSERRVLFVGRLARKKGVEYLIRAFPDVLARHPDTRLLVVGDGPCRGELEGLATQLQLGDCIRFTGAQPPASLPQFYRSSHLFVGPSVVARSGDTEAFGLVFAEAMASGLPVVGTAVGGIPEVVIAGRTGLIVEPKSPAALASAINHLLDSPAEAGRMGALGRRWVRRRFDWRRVAQGYADLLAQAAGGARTEPRLTTVNMSATASQPERDPARAMDVTAGPRHASFGPAQGVQTRLLAWLVLPLTLAAGVFLLTRFYTVPRIVDPSPLSIALIILLTASLVAGSVAIPYCLLAGTGADRSVGQLYLVVTASTAANYSTPVKAGIPLRVYLYKRLLGISPATGSALLGLEIVLATLVPAAISLFALLLFLPEGGPAVAAALTAMVIGAAAALAFVRNKSYDRAIAHVPLPGVARRALEPGGDIVAALRGVPLRSLGATAGTFVAMFVFVGVRSFFAFQLFGGSMNVVELVGIGAAAFTLGSLSLLPMGLGVRDATLVALFVQAGADRDIAIAVAALDRLLSTGVPLLLGILSAQILGLSAIAGRKGVWPQSTAAETSEGN